MVGFRRRFTGNILQFGPKARPYDGNIPSLTDEQSRILSLLSAPVDSHHLPPQNDSDDWCWGPATPDFTRVPTFTTVVPSDGRIRGVIFDICGSIIVSMHGTVNHDMRN